MSKLLAIREWLTFNEALRYASNRLGEAVSQEDFLSTLSSHETDARIEIKSPFYVFEPHSEKSGYPYAENITDKDYHDDPDEIEVQGGTYSKSSSNTTIEINFKSHQHLDGMVFFALDFCESSLSFIFKPIYLPATNYSEYGGRYYEIIAVRWIDIISSNGTLCAKFSRHHLDKILDAAIGDDKTEQKHELSATSQEKQLTTTERNTTNRSNELSYLNQASDKFWANADPDDRTTHPNNDVVAAWLESKGISPTKAGMAASIIRPEWAGTGRKPEK